MGIVIVIILVILLLVFGISLLKYRNKALDYQEEIRAAKSKVRVAKSKYVKVMDNSTQTNQAAGSANGSASGMVNGGSGGIGGTFVTSAEMVERLASEYEQAQLYLNNLVSTWNKFIGNFPNLIYAAILRLKKEVYIDEENLDMSTSLSDNIDGNRV